MKLQPEEIIPAVIFMIGIMSMIAIVYSGYQAEVKQERFKKSCMLAGGIPLSEQCVKPGSFIEVKP